MGAQGTFNSNFIQDADANVCEEEKEGVVEEEEEEEGEEEVGDDQPCLHL